MGTWLIQATAQVALGNGTRQRGFVFGEIESDEKFAEAIAAALMADAVKVAECVVLNAGEDVAIEEVVNALRTAHQNGPVQVVDPDAKAEKQKGSSVDPGGLLVADLELTPGVLKSLSEAGLLTVAQVIAYGNEHEGLTSIDGIGAAAEKKIVEAVKVAMGG